MAENSGIEWTENTFNPWRGCTKVSEGCANCYADQQSKRNPSTLGIWGPNGKRVVAAEDYWKKPLKWNEQAAKEGRRIKVFCSSLADVFEDWNGPMYDHLGNVLYQYAASHLGLNPFTDEWWFSNIDGLTANDFVPLSMSDVRDRLFAVIDATPHLDWQLVTKRPKNIAFAWPIHPAGRHQEGMSLSESHFRSNVWLLTSVENQEQADKRIPELLKCRDLVPVLGLSCEPLLGKVNLSSVAYKHRDPEEIHPDSSNDWLTLYMNALTGHRATSMYSGVNGPSLDWVICGGESGPNSRPMHPDWARSLRDQCEKAGVPFFFKQGSKNNWDSFKDFSTFPSDLQVREFPSVHA